MLSTLAKLVFIVLFKLPPRNDTFLVGYLRIERIGVFVGNAFMYSATQYRSLGLYDGTRRNG